jgi:hypothetical protein
MALNQFSECIRIAAAGEFDEVGIGTDPESLSSWICHFLNSSPNRKHQKRMPFAKADRKRKSLCFLKPERSQKYFIRDSYPILDKGVT